MAEQPTTPVKEVSEAVEKIAKRPKRVNKKKVEKPKICEDKAEEINNLLINYQGQMIVMDYYLDGFIKKIEGIIRYISNEFKCLYINETRYEFRNIVGLKIK